jgi:hypothetical protein
MVFHVGVLPEIRELEPNNREAYPVPLNLPRRVTLPEEKPLELPVLMNGQIMPGDVDRFRFRARKGQKLVIEAQARSLIPYLADAVPGWFQATLALYDAKGKEVAFADDFRFNPDPVLFYKIPADGEYELEIRDSIYRGREDFVYRVSVSEQPFITQMFPLGGKAGVKTIASISGWNLPRTQLPLDTRPDSGAMRETMYLQGNKVSNSVPYAVDTLPEAGENESNNSIRDAQSVSLPRIINGRIDQPGDVDVFRFGGRAGGKVVAEVYARRLNSPVDSLLRLTDEFGKVVEWNDDHVLKESHLHTNIMGLITHHADSYLMAELPKDGTYCVHLSDSQNHGGQEYAYRLRISAPQTDFALRVAPSNLSIRAGGIVPISVHALRKDGFDGEIDVFVKDPDIGFKLEGATIPAGRNHVRMTLTAPAKGFDGAVALQLEGRAQVGDKTITRPVAATDDVMQAFLYRHLVPAKELSVMVQKARWSAPPVTLAGRAPIRIPEGGTTVVRMNTSKGRALRDLQLELREAPEGMKLHDVAIVPQGLAFRVSADKDALPTGFADNLIVEAFREYKPKAVKGKPAPQKRRTSMGVFPAIPFRIVQE